jgi:hypothetical protein
VPNYRSAGISSFWWVLLLMLFSLTALFLIFGCLFFSFLYHSLSLARCGPPPLQYGEFIDLIDLHVTQRGKGNHRKHLRERKKKEKNGTDAQNKADITLRHTDAHVYIDAHRRMHGCSKGLS